MTFKSDKQRKGFFAMKGLNGSNAIKFNNNNKVNKTKATSSKVSVTSSSKSKPKIPRGGIPALTGVLGHAANKEKASEFRLWAKPKKGGDSFYWRFDSLGNARNFQQGGKKDPEAQKKYIFEKNIIGVFHKDVLPDKLKKDHPSVTWWEARLK